MKESNDKRTQFTMVPVPPPQSPPIQDLADELMLLPGLRAVEKSKPFGCSCCHGLKTGHMVWVPDGIRKGDDPALVTEICRIAAYNGSWSGWCLKCAQALCPITNLSPRKGRIISKIIQWLRAFFK